MVEFLRYLTKMFSSIVAKRGLILDLVRDVIVYNKIETPSARWKHHVSDNEFKSYPVI